MILSDTVKMKEHQEDPEMLIDLMYRCVGALTLESGAYCIIHDTPQGIAHHATIHVTFCAHT